MMKRNVSLLALLFVTASVQAQRKSPIIGPDRPEPVREIAPGLRARLPRPAPHSLGALSAREIAVLAVHGRVPRIGVHRTIAPALSEGNWEVLADGTAVWRLTIRSDGAAGLRVQFAGFSARAGRLWVYGENEQGSQGPYTDEGIFGNGDFWTGTVWGDSAVIEYQPANPADRTLPFEIKTISHSAGPRLIQAVRDHRRAVAPASVMTQPDAAGACNLDVSCYPEWADAMKMVSEIHFEVEENGEKFQAACTASLVGTRNNSLKPYMLTAGHCISSETEARSVETFWSYQTSSCHGAVPLLKDSTVSQTGAHYLASGSMQEGDYSLLLLKNVPGGVLYSGWDATEIAIGSNLVGVHHPAGSYKRILFGHRAADQIVDVEGDLLPSNLYYVLALDSGIAQPGSSGSALFSSPGVIVGTLTWGPGNDGEELCALGKFSIGYGRFSVAYPALMNWLEDLPFSQVIPSKSDILFSGTNGLISGGPQQTVQLTTESVNPVTFGVRSDAPWIQVSTPVMTASASQPAPLTITVNPKMLPLAKTYAGTVTVLSGAAPPQYINVRAQMKVDVSSVTVSADPNPVHQGSDGLWAYTLRVRESAGVSTRLTLLRIDGHDYSNQILDWFGTDKLPGGSVLESPLKSRILFAPATQTIEVGGMDDGGKNWYQVATVSLVGQ